RSTALMCTNTSFDPSVGWMNPNPFCELKNFTVPVAIMALLAFDTPVNPMRDHRAPDKASEFWEVTWERPKSSVSRQAENQGCGRSVLERRHAVKRQAARSSWLCLATRSCGSFALLMRYCCSSPSDGSTRTTL